MGLCPLPAGRSQVVQQACNSCDACLSSFGGGRKLDVRRLAVARWGSWEAVQAEYRRRITRS